MSRREPGLVDIDVVVHHETDKALLVSPDGRDSRAVWLPRSVVEVNERKGSNLNITMPYKWALEKGLI